MKVVPPFRREHFLDRQKMESDVNAAIREILCIFHPKFRPMVTISRINLTQLNRNIQILMVTAPEEAEEDLDRAKLNGIQIMGKTVFPTGEEFWRFVPSEFPKRALLRVNNLPILCTDEELEELMELPADIKLVGDLLRESNETELGRLFTGRAMVPIIIPSKEHEILVKQWSILKNSENITIWNEVPIYMSMPSLHKCRLCEQEGRRQVMGHDEKWCRIVRQTTKPLEEEAQTHESVENEVQMVSQNEQTKESEMQQNSTHADDYDDNDETVATNPNNSEDDVVSHTSSSDDDNNETVATNQNSDHDGRKRNWQEVKKKKRKRSNKSTKSVNSGKATNSTEYPVRKSLNLNSNG